MSGKKIQIVTIATGLYRKLLDEFIKNVSQTFLRENLRFQINILTDQVERDVVDDFKCSYFQISHKQWPLPTLERYKNFLLLEDSVHVDDLVIYSDVDMKFLAPINPDITKFLFGVDHPGYFNRKKKPFITDPKSKIYIKPNDRERYICGGLQGGVAKYFFEASRTLSKLIEQDILYKNIPKWHDESYWNYYYHSNKEKFVILGPEYCWPEEWAREQFEGKVLALTKDKDLTKSKSNTNFILTKAGRIKRMLRKSTY